MEIRCSTAGALAMGLWWCVPGLALSPFVFWQSPAAGILFLLGWCGAAILTCRVRLGSLLGRPRQLIQIAVRCSPRSGTSQRSCQRRLQLIEMIDSITFPANRLRFRYHCRKRIRSLHLSLSFGNQPRQRILIRGQMERGNEILHYLLNIHQPSRFLLAIQKIFLGWHLVFIVQIIVDRVVSDHPDTLQYPALFLGFARSTGQSTSSPLPESPKAGLWLHHMETAEKTGRKGP